MNYDLKGKKILVSGATRGLGRAMAEIFARNGVDLAICARNAQLLEQTVQQLQTHGVNVYAESVDVVDKNALQAWVKNAHETLGEIDAVIANPSAFSIGNSEQDWQHGVDVDLMGTINMVEAALPFLEQSAKQNGYAAIVTMSSVMATLADGEAAYGAVKAAIVNYTKGLARRLAAQNIRANSISPGTIYCDDGFWGNAKQHMPDVYESYLQRNPMGRMGRADEIAHVAAFLVSPASSFVTGANIVVDGAYTDRVNY